MPFQLLTCKLLHPSSELESERWLQEASAVRQLYEHSVESTRYRLYNAATALYNNKKAIETALYSRLNTLFSGKSKIVIYDLTNMYFTGQMRGSEKADFGRSKQKQSGRKLIGLALSIDAFGFVRHSRFYNGNVSDPGSFEDMIEDVVSQLPTCDTPVIVMDAGIATEDNLEVIRQRKYDYVCVSRSKPKKYDKISAYPVHIQDNRGNKIELTKVSVEDKKEHFLHIKSEQKKKKEDAIDLYLNP